MRYQNRKKGKLRNEDKKHWSGCYYDFQSCHIILNIQVSTKNYKTCKEIGKYAPYAGTYIQMKQLKSTGKGNCICKYEKQYWDTFCL